jgi:hypothetical protein
MFWALEPERVCNPFRNVSSTQIYRNVKNAPIAQQGKINRQALAEHTIFVTGLIYKEAYFLIPDLQAVLDAYATPVHYKNG